MFVCRAIRNALQERLSSILQNYTGIREAFEAAVVQVIGTSSFVREVTKVLVSDLTILAPLEHL